MGQTDMCDPTGEVWLPVVGWEGLYEVSDLGRVKRLFEPGCGWRILKPAPDKGGYLTVSLSGRGRGHRTIRPKVHKLVALAFLGPRPPGMEVCHNDSNPANPALVNLRYDTPLGNAQDKRLRGTHHNTRKTHCKRGHEFTPENTRVNPKGRRECRICIRMHDIEKNRRARERRAARGLQVPYNSLKTHCPQGHPYDEENTYINPGSGGRMCLTCMRARRRKAA